MSGQTVQSVADSLETSTELLAYMPYLLQDLWALGSAVDEIATSVYSLNLPPRITNVLDLGCGKGAVSIKLALIYGFRTVGIDLMDAFLAEARKKAAAENVAHLCEFIHHDIEDYVKVEHDFDLIILASLGGIFGSFQTTIEKLRSQVKAGGYILIDDGFLQNDNTLNRRGYEHYRDHETTISELTAFNDRLIQEISTTASSLTINADYLAAIQRRGAELTQKHPELKTEIDAYIQLQAEECDVIENEIEGALWLLQKVAS